MATVVVLGFLIVFVVVAGAVVIKPASKDKSSSRAKSTSTTLGATTTTTRGPVNYTVKQGDSLLNIAKYFGVTPRAIIDANHLADPDRLVAGRVLVIPPVVLVKLEVSPEKATVGETIELVLTGAEPNEIVRVEIHRPTGVFTGPAHYASSEGTVRTTYQLGAADPPGAYTIVAKGDQITNVQATLEVRAAKQTQPQ